MSSERLPGEAGVVQQYAEQLPVIPIVPDQQHTQPPSIVESGANVFDRIRNKWTTLVAVASTAVAIATTPTFEEQPAYAANTETAVIGTPYTGGWSTYVHPASHANYSADWATDIYALPGAEAKFNVSYVSGNAVYTVSNVADTSCSAGKRVRVNVKVDNVDVGWVQYEHLETDITDGSIIQPGALLGKTKNWGNLSCYQVSNDNGVHLHVGMKNTQDKHACYVNHNTQGIILGGGANLGVLGSSNTGIKQACAEIPGSVGGSPSHPPTRNNVNFTTGDNKEDIAWYELYPGYPGTLGAINSSGSHQYIGWKEIGIGPASWKGTGDFNGDGKTDIAWHEGNTLTVFHSSGQSFGIAYRLPGIGVPTWAGVGDFNNDGKDDIAWHEQSTGSLAAFITNAAGNWMDIAYRANGIGPADWAGVGDFNGDGKDDIAWHEGSTLTNIASTGSSWGIEWRNPGIGRPNWAQVGEFTGDDKDDIAWYESASSTVTTLAGDTSTFDIRGRMFGIGAPTWAYVGDFNGDNKDDVAWYEQGSGSLASFISNGSHFYIGWKALGIGRPTWAGVGDFNGDGKDDVAWHEGDTLTNIVSTGNSWGILWRTPGIGAPLWASRGGFPSS